MNARVEASSIPAAPDWWSLLTDREFLADPYPALQRLRARGPVQFDPVSGVYFILGHREFGQVARAPQMGRDTRLWRDGWCSEQARERDPLAYQLYSELQPQMINMNPPDHRRMRAVYEYAFKPEAVARLAPMIEAEAVALLDALAARTDGPVDLIEHYAGPLPLRVLHNLFEIPADERIGRWSASLIRIGDLMMTAEQKQEAQAALHEFKAFLAGHLAERQKQRGEGLIDAVLEAWDDGTMDEQETMINLVAMLIAGHETTVTLIGNGMLSLLRHPDQLTRLRSERSLMRSAINEFLRYEPGGNMILRVAIEDLEVGGVTIPAGAMAIGLIGAVNRDPERFSIPDILDIARNPNPHFTFGSGIHVCVGAPLARLEAHIAFDALLDRFPRIDLAGEPAWRLDRINARGLGALPVHLGAAA
jgi:cytochrome P450